MPFLLEIFKCKMWFLHLSLLICPCHRLINLKSRSFFGRTGSTLSFASDFRRFWRFLNNKSNPKFIIQKTPKSSLNIMILWVGQITIFNEYFLTVFELGNSSEPLFHGSVSSAFSDDHFNVSDVYNILYKVDDHFTQTLDGIFRICFQRLAAPLVLPLCIFFRVSVNSGGCIRLRAHF